MSHFRLVIGHCVTDHYKVTVNHWPVISYIRLVIDRPLPIRIVFRLGRKIGETRNRIRGFGGGVGKNAKYVDHPAPNQRRLSARGRNRHSANGRKQTGIRIKIKRIL